MDPDNLTKFESHPTRLFNLDNYRKWRLTFEGGKAFIEEYLRRFSAREELAEFNDRKAITYIPAFAKAAVREINNSIFQRMADIVRVGGSESYRAAITGVRGGVDLVGSSMTAFIGTCVLPELLSLGKVGVWVDMPVLDDVKTKAEIKGRRPYLYYYRAEDIINWTINVDTSELESLILRDVLYKTSDNGFPTLNTNYDSQYRVITVGDDGLNIEFYTAEGELLRTANLPGLERIPFAIFQIPESLLTDTADYQISHMNVASSDVAFTFRANFPIYTEQHDTRVESAHMRGAPMETDASGTEGAPGTAAAAKTAKPNEAPLGLGRGRRYPKGLDRPDFIHPSPEPLLASMEKQEQMKREIRQLVHLAVSNVTKMASAESKSYDERGLESGLAAIGLILERGERLIAEFWAAYESATAALISYPTSYNLENDDDRIERAAKLQVLTPSVASPTFQKEMQKKIARTLLGTTVGMDAMAAITAEIDKSNTVPVEVKYLLQAVEDGALSAETFGKIMGFPDGEGKKAEDEHARKLARVAVAQAPAGGTAASAAVALPNNDPAAARAEKKQDKAKYGSSGQRGDGK